MPADQAPERGGESPRHVIWDWNGTLLDDAAAVIEATTAAFAEAGIALAITEATYRRHFTRPIPLFYERLLGRAVEPEEWLLLDRGFHAHYGRLQERCRLAPGAREVLAEIRARGWTQSVCSMLPHQYLMPALERHRIRGYFSRVDGLRGDERGGAKLAHLNLHLERLAVRRSSTVLIGDTVDDALAARTAGIASVLVDGGAGLHDSAAIAAAGAPVAESLPEALALLTSQSAWPANQKATSPVLDWAGG
ncbi:MAG TPA: HAD family hydrolase [Candidatus Binatia bacterium]|nr:HAD family hydrolase [Candidatus Binatia bacterium]